jgi:predicted peroxiredoxin
MTEKQEKIMYFCTHASGNPEKAAMPFVMANAALAMDVKAIVVLQGEGVYLAKRGYAAAGRLPAAIQTRQRFYGAWR